jgi:hypothetical protein
VTTSALLPIFVVDSKSSRSNGDVGLGLSESRIRLSIVSDAMDDVEEVTSDSGSDAPEMKGDRGPIPGDEMDEDDMSESTVLLRSCCE